VVICEQEESREATTTADAREDPTSQPKTCEETPTPAITRQSHRLDRSSRVRPSSTGRSTPGTRVLGLDPSGVHSISPEKSTKRGHRSRLGGIAVHRPSRGRTWIHPRFDLIRNIHHPEPAPRDSSQQQEL